jgi:hypothetical protein
MPPDPKKRKTWDFITPQRGWRIVCRADATRQEREAGDPRDISAEQIDRWIADPSLHSLMLDMCRTLGLMGHSLDSRWSTQKRQVLRRDFEQALRRKELVAIKLSRARERGAGAAAEAPVTTQPPARAPQPAPIAEKSWIEIALKDRCGKPVVKERFRIVLPDGSVFEGKLDDNGMARKENIDPGMCTVSFPELGKSKPKS